MLGTLIWSKMRVVPPPPFLRKSTFKTLLFSVNDFWGYPSRWTQTSVHVNTLFKIDKLKKLLSGGERGVPERYQSGTRIDISVVKQVIFLTSFKTNSFSLPGLWSPAPDHFHQFIVSEGTAAATWTLPKTHKSVRNISDPPKRSTFVQNDQISKRLFFWKNNDFYRTK